GVELTLQSIFEASTVELMGARIDALGSTGMGAVPLTITPQDRVGHLPLSYQQQSLWFIDQFESELVAYNIQSSLKFVGDLNLGALKRALNETIRRHESLRTNFIMDDNGVSQVIRPPFSIELPIIDITRLKPEERKKTIINLIKSESDHNFNLSSERLIRAKLINISKYEKVLCLTMHHIITDGWSSKIIIKELTTLYNSFSRGLPSPLPKLKCSYVDYSICHRSWVIDEVLNNKASYWDANLSGYNKLISLPLDFCRPKKQTYSGSKVKFRIPKDVSSSLLKFSEKERATLFMTLMSVINLLLSRYSGEEDICVGTVVSNRNNIDIEPIVGYFINTLVIRTKIYKNSTFTALLNQVKNATIEAFNHQEVPFECVVERLVSERHLNHSPLFQVLFILQDFSDVEPCFDGLDVSNVEVDVNNAKYDLTIEILNNNDELSGWFEFNSDLFKYETIKNMVGCFIHLLSEVANNPFLKLSDYELIDSKQRSKLLTSYNDTAVKFDLTQKVTDLFEKQVKASPDSISVCCCDEKITYEELNKKSNQLARYLINYKPFLKNKLVGVLLEKEIDLIVSILGILKAGGAYVPLDINYPSSRLEYFSNDALLSVIITKENIKSNFSFVGDEAICIDEEELKNKLGEISPCNIELDNFSGVDDELSYVIYTSGSTGKPKGVKCSHTSLSNFIYSMQSRFNLDATDTLLSVTPFSFDISILEFFLPLSFGARVVLMPHGKTSDGIEISNIIKKEKVTIMQATPATWKLLDEHWPSLDYKLKTLCGGEELSKNLAECMLNHNIDLWNLYGPTEATVWCASYKVDQVVNTIPIGKPLENTKIFVLDEFLNLSPIGVKGELYISGFALSLGYLNNEELTSECFINNPFYSENESEEFKLLYKTGDSARWLLDGNLELNGRSDNQVKIRGFRIELGEVESALLESGLFKDVVVSSRNDSKDNKLLIAYYLSAESKDAKFNLSYLRDYLSNKLPHYMVPSLYVELASFPRLPN
ncbi:amino acid adenylation domain-containing protein, partial [Vibrio sp. 10N.237.312.B06]|uniref:non-ribosomal peptide synthetase n=1 Tax=Vibrio sp. 10N.237.312.B06 TaxID=3229974 RepID=UPI00354F5513